MIMSRLLTKRMFRGQHRCLTEGVNKVSFKELRDKKGVTQQEIAKQLNISRTTVAMWENGSSKPRADKLVQLAQILGCTVDELLRG